MNSQPPRHYTKSSRSGGSGGNCVEWAHTPGGVYIRDSKNPTGPQLTATHTEWSHLLTAARTGQNHPWISHEPTRVHIHKDDHRLTFTSAEWTAFVEAIHAGECEPANS